MVSIRAQNRSDGAINRCRTSSMVAPGYTTAQVPFIERLSPDEVAMIRMPLTIDMGTGGSSGPTSYSTRKAGGRVKKR